jgi:hypothetical protein
MESPMNTTMYRMRTIDLAAAQMLTLDSRRARRMRVLCGTAWLTSEDEAADSVVQAGDELVLPRSRTLIEALGPVRLLLTEAALPWTAGWPLAWRRLRRHFVRWQLGPVAAADGRGGQSPGVLSV